MIAAGVRRTALTLLAACGAVLPLAAQARVADLTTHGGDVPVRLVGYGLVVGLEGTGDRSFGTSSGAVQTVRSVTNLLRRFNIEVPDDRIRLRNVAAVLVTAEVSPYLRPGGRFDIQVASLGDATSLRGGVLWVTPLLTSPDAPPIASAQGAMPIQPNDRSYPGSPGMVSGRVSDGGVLEMSLPLVVAETTPTLALRAPDIGTASRIVAAINAAHGAGTARVEDAGSVALKLPAADSTNSAAAFLAAIDTLAVAMPPVSRIVIDAHSGVVVAGGEIHVASAVISLKGITVRVGDSISANATATPGVLALGSGSSVRDIAVGLQALGALPSEVATVFDGLRAAGAITAAVVIR
ncbi:MAG TPA: flagellar basal body P-ring protein FlgI [Gemmatimonadales bacterium]|nr:flagellar basal body P-ring protein FlgI [Gemmatimonadales bacterium]